MSGAQAFGVQDVVRRLELLEQERAVIRTLHRYGHSMDYGLEQEWVDCFTEDGVLDVRRRDATGRAVGRQALATFITAYNPLRGKNPGYPKHPKHIVVEPVIVLTGDTALVESYLVGLAEHKGRPVVWSFGRYRDRMVKCPDGVWRLQERVLEQEARWHDVSYLNSLP